ncbi:phosphotransferase family protein [Sphingomonas sp. NBWT7]|uniref:phosphotransferase family protein n=1 Tax=Sphingomonas sp. NBWT7 TaxID=2596913 RepID=UPI001625D3AE|nr:phosphotransferase family protein [Sphingomonas sp. NBWT7]QNE32506.1 phosphotransferase family protein [Sphingomonas sp. NBWT7]
MSVSSGDFASAIKGMMSRTAGVELSATRLLRYIQKQPDFDGTIVGIELDQRPRTAGASSGTQLFDIFVEAGGTRTTRRLVFRYDTGATFFKQYDMAAQFEVMAALNKAGYPVPAVLWLDTKGEIFGGSGMIMQRVEASAPHVLPFEDGPIIEASPAERRELLFNIIDVLARLHDIPPSSLNVPSLHVRGGGATPLEGEILWGKREIDIALEEATLPPERLQRYIVLRERLAEVAAIILARAPTDRPYEVIHADPGFVNYMTRGAEVAAVLDWEVCQLGYGESDVSYLLSQIEFYHQGRAVTDGVPTREELIRAYGDMRGELRDWEFCELFSAWRMANYCMLITSRLPHDQQDLEVAYMTSGRERLERTLAAFQQRHAAAPPSRAPAPIH